MSWQLPPKPGLRRRRRRRICAMNGLNHSSASGGRRVRDSTNPSSRPASGRNPLLLAIADQKRNEEPGPDGERDHGDEGDDGRRLRALHERGHEQAERPETDRRHEQDEVAAQDVVRGDAAEDEHDRRQRDRGEQQQEDTRQGARRACRGRSRATRSASWTSRSRVCFSRSRLIAPAVDAGARTSTMQRHQHQQRDEERLPDLRRRGEAPTPKPPVKVRSMSVSTIHAKPARRSR